MAPHAPPLVPAPAPPLVSMADRRSQQLHISQLPPPTSSATIRRSWSVATKSEKQKRLESQQGHDAEAKVKKEAKAIEEAKAMKPRKEDMSQLEYGFSQLGSSP